MDTTIFNSIKTMIDATHRPVEICAAVKTIGCLEIEQAIHHGITHFGENYLQEAQQKYNTMWWAPLKEKYHLTLHFIGHLQSNKAEKAALLFDSIDSVDSHNLAISLNRARASTSPLPILLQYNPLNDESKHGVTSLDQLLTLAHFCHHSNHLLLRGIMLIAPKGKSEQAFVAGKTAFDVLNSHLDQALPTLSMGMSNDLKLALTHGSTMIRVGTSLFGARS